MTHPMLQPDAGGEIREGRAQRHAGWIEKHLQEHRAPCRPPEALHDARHHGQDDGRWLAEIMELPGVMAYGSTPDDAIARAKALALRVVADQIEEGERTETITDIHFETI